MSSVLLDLKDASKHFTGRARFADDAAFVTIWMQCCTNGPFQQHSL